MKIVGWFGFDVGARVIGTTIQWIVRRIINFSVPTTFVNQRQHHVDCIDVVTSRLAFWLFNIHTHGLSSPQIIIFVDLSCKLHQAEAAAADTQSKTILHSTLD
jgi:hypothetical protein